MLGIPFVQKLGTILSLTLGLFEGFSRHFSETQYKGSHWTLVYLFTCLFVLLGCPRESWT